MFQLAYRWTLMSIALFGMNSYAQAQNEQRFESQVVIVQFEKEIHIPQGQTKTRLTAFDSRAAQYEIERIERAFPFLDHVQPTRATASNLTALRRTWYVRYRAEEDPEQVSKVLANVEGVAYAEPILINRVFDTVVSPDDPRFAEQTYLEHMRLSEAWSVTKGEDGSPPPVIAIIDGGADWRHEDLAANVWTNADEVAGNGLDDDGNGFIDDVHGVNFANGDDSDNDPTGLPSTPRNAAHGTWTAGAASAVSDNGIGIAGAAWNARLMHINVGCPSGRDGFICFGYEGILYAAASGADIISCSWGGYAANSTELQYVNQILNLTTDMGTLLVAAAGNETSDLESSYWYPGRHPRVLSVGATERDSRRIAPFSNFGRTVSVFAPGVSILSTAPGGNYVHNSGTSLAAPLVAGVTAMVRTAFPSLDPDGLREQVRMAAESIDAENPAFAHELGRGFINAYQAVQSPAYPAVRLKRWSLEDSDGDGQIGSGESVGVRVLVVNHLAQARNLSVALIPAQSYPYLNFTNSEVAVGMLDSGDSTEVTFSFTVAASAPGHQRIRLFMRVVDGSLEDTPDMISFGVNEALDETHSALRALYVSTNGDNWLHNTNWDVEGVPTLEELQTWYGVWMPQGWLQRLDLGSNQLNGTLPAAIKNLSTLESLNLSENGLFGRIPPEVGEFSRLSQLLLNKNGLSGIIPPALGNLSNLQRLDLSANKLNGVIPSELGNLSRLTELYISHNILSSTIPRELGNLSRLQYLQLTGNNLSGAIPPELGGLSLLKRLVLSQNRLSGPIPAELGNLSELEQLTLDFNYLTGALPIELRGMSGMKFLSLSYNGLTGPILPELGELTNLNVLLLDHNAFTGTIPGELARLSRLTHLDLGGNMLGGSLPPELGEMPELSFLIVVHNKLTGTIPSELGNLSNLVLLEASGNQLTGTIPVALGNLRNLQYLFLHGNDLSGSIPSELGSLSRLFHLGMGGNALSGTIPPELGNLLYLQSLTLASNELVGFVPAELGNLESLQFLHLANNALEGKLPRSLTRLKRLDQLYFGGGQALCAPQYAEFQQWLSRMSNWDGPVCEGLHIAGSIEDQSYTQGVPIDDIALPEADDGIVPYRYTLVPSLPSGIRFDPATRTLHGTPVSAMAKTTYTYTATDAVSASDSVHFSIEVISSPLARDEEGELPDGIVLHGNYPNPFAGSTNILLALPEAAEVSVTILDLLGRTVQQTNPLRLPAGRHRAVPIDGTALPAGAYPYRVIIRTAEVTLVRSGMLTRIW